MRGYTEVEIRPFRVKSAGMWQRHRVGPELWCRRCRIRSRHSPIEGEVLSVSTADARFLGGIHRKVTWLLVYLPTGVPIYGRCMAHFNVTLAADRTEVIEHADAYQQEGPLTTFFAFAGGREVIDSWSSRLASFRTVDVLVVRRVEPELENVGEPAFDESGVAPLLRSA